MPGCGRPPGTHERAVVQGWSIFAMTELEAPAIESSRQRETNPEASAKAAERCADAVAVLEGAIGGTPPYLACSRFTVADIVTGGVLGIAVRVGAIEPSPTIATYMESLGARPARQRAASKLGARGPVRPWPRGSATHAQAVPPRQRINDMRSSDAIRKGWRGAR